MATELALQHANGLRRKAYLGWSWTGFFFGPIPALCRGDWLGACLYILALLILAAATAGFGCFILWFVWGAVYNRWHARRLIENGYQIVGSEALPLAAAIERVSAA